MDYVDVLCVMVPEYCNDMLLGLSLICKRVWLIVSGLISNKYYFRCYQEGFKMYKPCKVITTSLCNLPPTTTYIITKTSTQSLEKCFEALEKDSSYKGAPPFSPIEADLIRDYSEPAHNIVEHLYTKKLSRFKGSIPVMLPPSVTHLTIDDCFELSISAFPNLTHLVVKGGVLCKRLPSLPASLQFLALGKPPLLNGATLDSTSIFWALNIFNKLEGDFPPNLQYLSLPDTNYHIPNLPPSLNHLVLGGVNFLPPLPRSLQLLTLRSYLGQPLPPVLTYLNIRYHAALDIGTLPCTLRRLIVKSSSGSLQKLPALTHLSLGDYDSNISELPESITHLDLGARFRSYFEARMPNLTHLFVGAAFDYPLRYLPKLTHLGIRGPYNHPLPISVTHVYSAEKVNDLDPGVEIIPFTPQVLTELFEL